MPILPISTTSANGSAHPDRSTGLAGGAPLYFDWIGKKPAPSEPAAGKRSAAAGRPVHLCSLPDGNHGDNQLTLAL